MRRSDWDISKIKLWLKDNEIYLNFLINETKCEKWHKWKDDKDVHIYPCMCHSREKHCVFIETYYKFEKVHQLYNQADYFKELVQWHKQIEDNNDEILKWLLESKRLFESFPFNPIVEIVTNLAPYKTTKFQLSKDDFQSVITFQEIYLNELYKREFEK